MEDSGNVVLCVDAEQPSTFKSNFVNLGLKEVVRMLLGSVGRFGAYWYCRLELLKKEGHFHCVCGGVLKRAFQSLSLYPSLSLELRGSQPLKARCKGQFTPVVQGTMLLNDAILTRQPTDSSLTAGTW